MKEKEKKKKRMVGVSSMRDVEMLQTLRPLPIGASSPSLYYYVQFHFEKKKKKKEMMMIRMILTEM